MMNTRQQQHRHLNKVPSSCCCCCCGCCSNNINKTKSKSKSCINNNNNGSRRTRRQLRRGRRRRDDPLLGYYKNTTSSLFSFSSFLLLISSTVMILSTLVVVVHGQETEEILDKTVIRPAIVDLPDYGRVQGRRTFYNLITYDFYGGIPYAAPPVGDRRWSPPEPPIPWHPAKLDATSYGPDCWQLVDSITNPGVSESDMSEDCLYLNVFTPAGRAASASSSKGNLLPVMVWLHGGAFQQGGSGRAEYDGKRLADKGTIVVTINYRLGALGFLVSSPDGLFGNFGLMDQRAALHWIKNNIKYFGGNPDNITLFGESAGAVMTLLHLMMDDATSLVTKAIIQSNPLGLQFRSVVVADFIGEALKANVDCRDLACLRAERVEEIMRAQSSLMGVPRSVGDFFTWGPTLTDELKLTLGVNKKNKKSSSSGGGGGGGGSSSPLGNSGGHSRGDQTLFRDLDSWKWQTSMMNRDSSWASVNVSQPLKNYERIPDGIPIILGTNRNEGEMFVHGAFPITMSKAVYWMFVGALFRDSASRVLKHYRGYVDQIEKDAALLSQKQVEEERNRQYYQEHQDQLDLEYQRLLDLNSTATGSSTSSPNTDGNKVGTTSVEALLETWSRGGGGGDGTVVTINDNDGNATQPKQPQRKKWHHRFLPFGGAGGNNNASSSSSSDNTNNVKEEKARIREMKRKERMKKNALKDAAKVVVDYRPVMSRIIDDYLFRCPTWHLAHTLSRHRLYRGQRNNVYVYQFSHSTHVPGFSECWGKSCHTAELPYVFQAMDVIRTNYSTLSKIAQDEAPTAPVYPYTDILYAYREAAAAAANRDRNNTETSAAWDDPMSSLNQNNLTASLSKGFQHVLHTFFGDYFKEDTDEETASDMASRWVAFAKSGNPNYSSNRAQWRPWRYVFDDDLRPGHDNTPWDREAFDQIFHQQNINDDQGDNGTSSVIEGYLWSEDPEEQVLRRRALKALQMEVVEEDVFQTFLSRTPKSPEGENDHNPLSFLFGASDSKSRGKDKYDEEQRMTRRAVRQLQQIAQDMGLLGKGLQGEPHHHHHHPRRFGMGASVDHWVEDFFPEMLELKWPPEGRLVERDCTCDMWDRIRYRY